MRGLAFVLGKKSNTNSYPLSRGLELKYNLTVMKWLTPHVFQKIVAARGGE